MGSSLVATMVNTGAQGPTDKKLHPFFAPSKGVASDKANPSQQSVPQGEAASDIQEPKRKKHRSDAPTAIVDESTPEIKKQKRKRNSGKANLNDDLTNHLTTTNEIEATQQTLRHIPTPPLSDASARTVEQQSTVVKNIPTADAAPAPKQSPQTKKVLKFNPKTGTLGSPPKPKKTSPPSKIITIKYGQGNIAEREAIGRKITAILETPPEAPQTPTKKSRRGRPRKSQASNVPVETPPRAPDSEPLKVEGTSTAKETHPFFTGKAKPLPGEPEQPVEASKPSPAKRHTISMATPVSPRKQKGPGTKPVHFGSLNNPGLLRIPGAKHPAWPAQGTAHVRGIEEVGTLAPIVESNHLHSRKFKGQTVGIGADASVIDDLVKRLTIHNIHGSGAVDDEDTDVLSRQIRLPRQHFESGRKLQVRIRPHLRTMRHTPEEQPDLNHLASEKLWQTQPMVARLYNNLITSLSAFDRSACETATWCQKYAPSTATEILQSGKEALYLKAWLEGLRIQSVDSGPGDPAKDKVKSEKPKKRRKKEEDDFIVHSDEEDYELDEVSDGEPDWTPAGSGHQAKTVLRPTRQDGGRMNNAVIISGPHGCGKTAAVYAVAKEIGYEVFEINSSSRRSGKDLLDKIGDMTRNHLVQQHQAGGAGDEDVADNTEQDIKSGKQGMMTSFFKAKSAAAKKQKPVTESKTPAKSQRAQKQSLILLEEVDILYEEDKQFWTTLMTMITQSRRPFIMTCNDESLIPLQSLALHGILRFAPPPAELAVDVSLLIAANEGHALERWAVESLYVSRGHDLRATITDLNYWCQIGVGDRRGGFDWFCLRWPKGIDKDDNGDTVRVISENTYLRGMGWLAHDTLAEQKDFHMIEEDAIHQSWDHWQVSVGDWHEHLDMRTCTRQLSRSTSLHDIDAYQSFCEALSDGDVFSNSIYASALQEIIDPGYPEMSGKMKEDFSLGRQLLDAEPLSEEVTLERDITASLSSSARQCLMNYAEATQKPAAAAPISPVDETKAIYILESSFQRAPFQLTRMDLAHAFDPIAVSDPAPTTHLDPSVFDRTLSLIVLDVAPWVRSIVAFDEHLAKERKKLSNLLSEGGKRKRFRNTRAAYSALEGGERKSTRREKYFQGTLNSILVLKTGLPEWQDTAKEQIRDNDVQASAEASPEAMEETE